jgi:hypothetical protein
VPYEYIYYAVLGLETLYSKSTVNILNILDFVQYISSKDYIYYPW